MVQGRRGRPTKPGERYPSGKLKPSKTVPDLPASEPVSGVMWQRMLKDHSKVFGDSIFATELTRLGATGKLSPAEVALGLRIAGTYGRYEYFKGLNRSAASPHYIREYMAETIGGDTEDPALLSKYGIKQEFAFNPDDREERERAATEAFKELQNCIPMSLRSDVEALCVENLHVGYQQLLAIRQAFSIIGDVLPDPKSGLSKKQRRQLRKKRRPQLVPATKEKPVKVNALKDAFIAVQRKLSPHLSEEELETAWETMQALKSRSDFRLEKSGIIAT